MRSPSFAIFVGCLMIAAALYFRPTSTPAQLAGTAPSSTATGHSDPAPQPTPPSTEPPSQPAPAVQTGVRLQVHVDQTLVTSDDPEGSLLVEIGPDPTNAPATVPASLALVIDTSGSMEGRKLQDAKAAARQLLGALRPGDMVTLITYDSSANILIRPTVFGSPAFADAYAAIDRMRATGNTCVSCGLTAAYALAPDPRSFVRRVVVISDGVANEGIVDSSAIAALVRGANERGVSTSTIGLGRDYNERLMSSIAISGNGNYYFLAEPHEIARVLSREMQALHQLYAKNLVIRVTGQNGSSVALGYNEGAQRTASGVALTLGDVGGSSAMQFVFPVTFRTGELGEIARVELEFDDATGLRRSVASSVEVRRTADLEAAQNSAVTAVTARAEIQRSAAEVRTAMNELAAGNRSQAEGALRSTRARLSQAASVSDSPALDEEAAQLDALVGGLSAASAPAQVRDLQLRNEARSQEIGRGATAGGLYHSSTTGP